MNYIQNIVIKYILSIENIINIIILTFIINVNLSYSSAENIEIQTEKTNAFVKEWQNKDIQNLIKNNINKHQPNNLLNKIDKAKNNPNNYANNKFTNGLILFISASLPPQLLENYFEEAKEYFPYIVIRGFINNSLKQTVSYIQKLNQSGYQVAIDPKIFKQFNITKVPAIVLTDKKEVTSCLSQDCTPKHDKIIGNIPIKYALERFFHEGEFKQIASQIIQKSRRLKQ